MREVWGFDPEEVAKNQQSFGWASVLHESYESLTRDRKLERAARIPASAEAQIYELRRLFRL